MQIENRVKDNKVIVEGEGGGGKPFDEAAGQELQIYAMINLFIEFFWRISEDSGRRSHFALDGGGQ